VIKLKRQTYGSILVEMALTLPIFFMVVFSFMELSRAMYVLNTLNIAAQKVASKISINAKRGSSYDLNSFTQYTNQVRFPGSVISSDQFSFDVVNALNNSTVTNGQADGALSTKVVVTVRFPPPSSPGLKIPIFDPGALVGIPIFGPDGLMLSSQAVCFLERSRRPTLN